jgi:hypothetical protein
MIDGDPPPDAVTCAHDIGCMSPYWSVQYTRPSTDPPSARTTGVVKTRTERRPADIARTASNKVLLFKSDSARSLVDKCHKSFEVQEVHLIGDIESFPWLEPCINLHQSVDRLASVLILETLSRELMSRANEPNMTFWLTARSL